MASFKQVSLEIRPQPVTDDRYVSLIDNIHQQLYLRFGQELGFIHDDAVIFLCLVQRQVFDEFTLRLQSGTACDNAGAVPVLQRGLDHQRLLPALLIIVLYHNGVGGLGGPHCPVPEI